MATPSAPPLMHFPLAALYAQAGYAIRLASWDGSVGGHEVAWLFVRNALFYYANSSGARIAQGGVEGGAAGDVTAEDMAESTWTTLGVGCDFSSACACGDALLLQGVPGFPQAIEASVEPVFSLSAPNASMGLYGCDLPPSDWMARLAAASDCACYTAPTFGGTLAPEPPLPRITNTNGGAAPGTLAPEAAIKGREEEEAGGVGVGGAPGGVPPPGAAPGAPGAPGGPAAPPPPGAPGAPGGGPGGPRSRPRGEPFPSTATVTITATRTNDAPVECIGTSETSCPDAAPPDYQWIGSVTLSAPDSANAWSTTIRRNGIDGGVIVWTGNLSDTGTHDFGPIFPAAGIAPGAGFTFSVVCNELLGDGVCSDAATVSIPNCEACDAIVCEDPENAGNQIVCPDRYTLNVDDCFCYEDDDLCGAGQLFDFALGYCRDDCSDPGESDAGKVFNPGTGTCECPTGYSWSGAACLPCADAGTLLSTGPCESGFELLTYADGVCGEYTNPVEC